MSHQNLSLETINLDEMETKETSVEIERQTKQKSSHSFHLESIVISKMTYNIKITEGILWMKTQKTIPILKNIDLNLKVGEMTAILGPSGAGKTTLLNFLAMRITADSEAVARGYLVNGKDAYQMRSFRRSLNYVLQEDINLPFLTVRETLMANAELRLPKHVTPEQKLERVNSIIEKLKLTKCADTLVGSPGISKGISGGEKKRLNIGMELITEPQILFLDEPTSGLDSSIAFDVIEILKDLCKEQRITICMTIHQPSSDIFALFDNVLLMKDGSILSHASCERTLEIFEESGLKLPPNTNPAEFLLSAAMDKNGTNKEALKQVQNVYESGAENSIKKFPFLTEQVKKVQTTLQSHHNLLHKVESDPKEQSMEKEYKENRPSWFHKFKVLASRSWKSTVRDPKGLFGSLVTTAVMAVIVGLVFLRIGTDTQRSVSDRQGAILFLLINLGMSSLESLIATFQMERAVFLKEFLAKCSGVSPYYFSKFVTGIPFQLIAPVIQISISYWMIGLKADFVTFLAMIGVVMLICLTMSGVGLAISSFAKDVSSALGLVPMFLLPLILLCGFFLTPETIQSDKPYFIWLHYISPFKYGYEIMMVNEFRGLKFVCEPEQLVNGICPISSGEQVLKNLSLDNVNTTKNWLFLLLISVVTQFVGFAVLYWRAQNYKKKGKL